MLIFRKLGIDPRMALPVLLLIAVALVVWAMMATAKQTEPGAMQRPAYPINAIKVTAASVQLTVLSQGTVQPRTESDLVAEVSGVVTWVSPQLASGGTISLGEPLIKIDPADFETAKLRALASLARSKAELRKAKQDIERMEKLQLKKLASRAQLDDARSKLDVARANLAEADANANQADRDIQRTVISAPYAGKIRSKMVGEGQFVNRGAMMAKAYATDSLEVRLPIADSELAFLNTASITSAIEQKPVVNLSANYAGKTTQWRGYIDRLEGSIDTRSRMVFAVAKIQVDDQIPPPVGLFVRATIAGLTKDNIVTIPRSSLRDGNHVLLVSEENTIESRSITILRPQGEQLLVSAGLSSGDIVNTSSSLTLAAGQQVSATVIAAAAPSEAAAPIDQ